MTKSVVKRLKKALSGLLVLALTLGMFPMPIYGQSEAFDDIRNSWAQDAIERWHGYGIVQGNNGQFKPNDPITRGELAVILNRLFDYQEKAENNFEDLDSNFYTDAVLKLAGKDIMKGHEGDVRPAASTTRQEAIVMIARAFDVAPDEAELSYADADAVADWAKGYISSLSEAGFIQGNRNRVNPTKLITRAEFITIINNMIGLYVTEAGDYDLADVDGYVLVKSNDVTLKNGQINGVLASGKVNKGTLVVDKTVALITNNLEVAIEDDEVAQAAGPDSSGGSDNSGAPSSGGNVAPEPTTAPQPAPQPQPQPTPEPTPQPQPTGPIVYYVAPNGDDSNTGEEDSPFATIKKALDKVKAERSDVQARKAEIILRGGTHQIRQTLELDNSHGNLTIKAYNNEVPVISGGLQLTGWTKATHNGIEMYEATVPSLISSNIRQLYINGERAIRANSSTPRTFRQNYPTRINSYYMTDGKASGYVLPLSAIGGDTRNGDDIELVFNLGWRSHRMAVSETTRSGSNVNLYIDPAVMEWSLTADAGTKPVIGKYCYVENAYGLLNEKNEFYHDQAASKIYYYPKDGTDMTSAETWVPSGVESLIKIDGTSKTNPVKDVAIEGITFKHSTWHRPNEEGASVVQANFYVNEKGQGSHTEGVNATGGVQAIPTIDLREVANISIKNNKLENLGTTGIRLAENTTDVHIIGNRMYDVSESAIVAGKWTQNFFDQAGEGKVLSTVIANNHIERAGVEFFNGPAIQCYYVDGIMIEHNIIKEVSYGGILLGWNGWQATEKDSSTARNQIVRYNWVEDYSNEIGDVGGIYTLGQRPGMEIYDNYFLKANRYHAALYFDEGSGFISAMNNVVEQNTAIITSGHTSGFRWLNCWIKSIHDINVFGNYTNRTALRNDGVRVYGDNTSRDNTYESGAGSGGNGTGWSAVPTAVITNAGTKDNYQYVNPKVAKAGDVAFIVNAIFRDENNNEDFGKAYQMVTYAVDGYYNNIAEDPFAVNPKLKENYGNSYSKGSYAEATKPGYALEVDLLERSAINKVVLDFTTDGYPTAYRISTSPDGIHYKEAAYISGNTSHRVETPITSTHARYIKVEPTVYGSKVQYVNVSAFVDDSLPAQGVTAPMALDYLSGNLVAHFDSERSIVDNTTDYVTGWNAARGSGLFKLPAPEGLHGAPTTTSVPKKPKRLHGAIDGRPSIYFDGFDDALEMERALSAGNAWTVAYVARAYGEDSIKIFDGSGYSLLSPTKSRRDEWALWTFSNESGNIKVYKNDQLVGERTAGNISKIGLGGNVGIRYKQGAELSHGDFTEFMVYNKALTASEVGALNGQVLAKYPSILNTRTVTFNSEGGTAVAPVQKKAYEKLTEPTAPTKDGKFFSGWYREPESRTYWNFATDEVARDMNLYARWTDAQEYYVTFSSNEAHILHDLEVELLTVTGGAIELAPNVFRLTAGDYSFSVASKGFKTKIVTRTISSSDTVYIDALDAAPTASELIDDNNALVKYGTPASWKTDDFNKNGQLHNGTRTHNAGIVGASDVVERSKITMSFKGTAINMYTQKDGGATNVEVNVYRGTDTTGTKVVDGVIADQRTGVGEGQQTGFQKTFSSGDLGYGIYTIEVKPSQSDVNGGKNGFMALDAFEIIDTRTPVNAGQKVRFTTSDAVMAYGITYSVERVIAGGTNVAMTAEADGSYLLEAGNYSYTATSKGYATKTATFTVADAPLSVPVTLAEAKEADVKLDDSASGIQYSAGHWAESDWNPSNTTPLYMGTRHMNYVGGSVQTDATVTYTFKGSGIKMYNQMHGGATNIEVTIHKGVGIGGEKVVDGAIADQRGSVSNTDGTQTGNQLTYTKEGLPYGIYTIVLKASQADITAGKDGFYTLDAFEVLGRKVLTNVPSKVTFTTSDTVMAHGMTYTVEKVVDGGSNVAVTAESDGSYSLTPGNYSYTATSKGYTTKTETFTAVGQDLAIAVTLAEANEPDVKVDDTATEIQYSAGHWVEHTWNPSNTTPLYNGTRHMNLVSDVVQTNATATYTFKGSGIKMYNQMHGAATNIEVNIYKGVGTGGEKVVDAAIADQRGSISTAGGAQTGNQLTYTKEGLTYGVYTIELKVDQSDIKDGRDGFCTLDAFEVLGRKTTTPPTPPVTTPRKVTLSSSNGVIAYDLTYSVEKVVQGGTNQSVDKESDGSYTLTPGQYSYTASSKGFATKTELFTVTDQALQINISLNEANEADVKVDDNAAEIQYSAGHWSASDWNPDNTTPLHNGTRHINYVGNAVQANGTVTYTFKGSGIKMYNQMHGGATNIEVTIHKGVGTSGEKVVDGAIADQRGSVSNTDGSQVGNQLTYTKENLTYGIYTMTLKASQADITAGMNGFYTLDALEVLGRK